jgi:protein O-mannosyl-transferase
MSELPVVYAKNKLHFKIALCLGLICILVFAAFVPCLQNGFVNWDDNLYVMQNPAIQSLSLANFKNLFTSFFISHYQPATILSYLCEFHFFVLDPFGYHLTNLILHLLNCLLVFWLVFLLTKKISVSGITAALFGIHPLQVESVAWVSELKILLYAFFFLAAMLAYLYYLKEGKPKFYYFSLCLFILSLLSKSMAVTLPLALFILDYFFARKPDKKMFIEKIPYFGLALIFGIIAIFGLTTAEAIRQGDPYGLMGKFMIASSSIVFYLNKLFWPGGLCALHPYQALKNPLVYPLIAVFILFIGVIISGKYTKKIVLGASLFLVTILPALQFIPNGDIIVAERYVYISSIGIFYIFAEGIIWLYSKRIKYSRSIKIFLLIILLVATTALVSITRRRCSVWKDSLSLWNDVLEQYLDCGTAYNNRGEFYLGRGELEKAGFDFNMELKLNPDFYEAYFNLASLNNALGNYNAAINMAHKSLAINPSYLKTYNLLMVAYGNLGKHSLVIGICKHVIKIDPFSFDAYFNLSIAYANLNNFPEAIVYGKKAVILQPNAIAARINLAKAYYFNRQYALAAWHRDKATQLGAEAIPEFLESLGKKPDIKK